MAVRFRKSIKLASGVRLNLNGFGLSPSLNLGPRGSSIGIGKRGTFMNVGIPGSGLSMRHQLSAAKESNRPAKPVSGTQVALSVSVSDDGSLVFKDSNGSPVSEDFINKAKKQQGEQLRSIIQAKCDEINAELDALGEIHLYTSPPVPHTYRYVPYAVPSPTRPRPKTPGFLCRWFKSCVAKVELANQRAVESYEKNLSAWEQDKAAHEAAEQTRKLNIDQLNAGAKEAIEQYFAEVLQDIQWPQETLVSFDVIAPDTLAVDVDLPEMENFPTRTATVPQRGYKLSIKDMGQTQRQKLYMQHIHGVGFRIAGEAFAASPKIQTVILSAYSQRPDKASGQITDQYLYSVRISATAWQRIAFDQLNQVDPAEALASFELRREMSKTGIFKPITPFDVQIDL